MKFQPIKTNDDLAREYFAEHNMNYDDNNHSGTGESMSELFARIRNKDKKSGLLIVKDMPTWLEEAALKPESKQLFGEIWFEDELCILFGDTGTGKSILAYQIADSIGSGQRTSMLDLQVPPQTVLYIDCELSAKQLLTRYTNEETKEVYPLSRNLKRAEIDPTNMPPVGMDYETYLAAEVEERIKATGARILIVDNITYLKNETEKAKDALGLMKHLKNLKAQYQLSILILAHTPKRDLSKPISRNDLAGSKMLINFCDSAFSIGESTHDKNLRYLKQIKARNTEILYGDDNVILCSVSKPGGFLSFNYAQHTTEAEHLKVWTEKERDERVNEAKQMHEEGKTQRQIAEHFSVSVSTVNSWLKKS